MNSNIAPPPASTQAAATSSASGPDDEYPVPGRINWLEKKLIRQAARPRGCAAAVHQLTTLFFGHD